MSNWSGMFRLSSYILPAIGAVAYVWGVFELIPDLAVQAILVGLVYLELRRAMLEGANEKAQELPDVEVADD